MAMPLLSGFPPQHRTAPNHKRFEGLYYYCAYWGHWDEVIRVDKTEWFVQKVDIYGSPIERVRSHRTPMWAGRFANKPFKIK